ncbi:MAG TPA: hypothetical protein VK539_23430 [Myxococcaceae bacterium]|nr:hypothetical protein [Myxococcaceae bacterium]
MSVEFEWRTYELLLCSDVQADGMYLEMMDTTDDARTVVLVAFYSDADGRMTLSAYRENLPLAAVEWFIAEAKRCLPPSGQAT